MKEFFNNKLNMTMAISVLVFLMSTLMNRIHYLFMSLGIAAFTVVIVILGVKQHIAYKTRKNDPPNLEGLSRFDTIKVKRAYKAELRGYVIMYVCLYVISAVITYYNITSFIIR